MVEHLKKAPVKKVPAKKSTEARISSLEQRLDRAESGLRLTFSLLALAAVSE